MSRKPKSVAPVAPVAPVESVAPSTLAASLNIVNACLSAIFAIGMGKVFPSPWVEWTPLKPDGKPDAKIGVEGTVDVNRILKGTPIVKPSDKSLAASLMQQWLKTPPTEGFIVSPEGVKTPVIFKLQNGLTVGEALVRKLVARKVTNFYHIHNLEWSGTDDKGNTVFGLGSDWVLFQKRWNDSEGDWKVVQDLYGFYPWGQPILSKANIISLYDKGKEAGYDLVEYVKVGRGKHAKIVVTEGFSLSVLESLE